MNPHQSAEGCRKLTSVVPLKAGERHCPFCAGYGANPVAPDYRHWTHHTQSNPTRCFQCDGSGKARP